MPTKPKPFLGFQTLGNIKQLVMMPCTNPPSLYVEAAVESTIETLWTLVHPDLKESYHITQGESFVCSFKKAILEAADEAPSVTDELRQFIFQVAEWADKTIWYLFVADVVADGVYNWSSNVLRMSACNGNPPPGFFSSHDPYGSVGSNPGDMFAAFDWFNDSQAPGVPPASPPAVQIGPGHTGVLTCAAQCQDPSHNVPLPTTITTAFTDDLEPLIVETSNFVPGAQGGHYTTPIIHQVIENTTDSLRTLMCFGQGPTVAGTHGYPPYQGFLCTYSVASGD